MPITDAVRQALALDTLVLPAKPKILSIEPTDYIDHTGEEAIQVWVTIDEDTPDSELTGKARRQISMAIHDSLLARGVSLYPYLQFGKPSELQELVTDA